MRMESTSFMATRQATFLATVCSTVSILAIVVALPLFYNHMQRVRTFMLSEVEYCKSETNVIWKSLVTGSLTASRDPRQTGNSGPRSCCTCHLGAPGAQGQPGKPGQPGGDGEPGGKGENGRDGKYISKAQSKSCQKCAPGALGPPGREGAKGVRGPRGAAGFPGPPGESKRPGPQGYPGRQGPLGGPGPRGPVGNPGRLLPGGNAPQGRPGPPGAVGPRGQPGTRGNDGIPGIAGLAGASGPPGERGNDGNDGPPGNPGSPGPPGDAGIPGSCSQCGKSNKNPAISNGYEQKPPLPVPPANVNGYEQSSVAVPNSGPVPPAGGNYQSPALHPAVPENQSISPNQGQYSPQSEAATESQLSNQREQGHFPSTNHRIADPAHFQVPQPVDAVPPPGETPAAPAPALVEVPAVPSPLPVEIPAAPAPVSVETPAAPAEAPVETIAPATPAEAPAALLPGTVDTPPGVPAPAPVEASAAPAVALPEADQYSDQKAMATNPEEMLEQEEEVPEYVTLKMPDERISPYLVDQQETLVEEVSLPLSGALPSLLPAAASASLPSSAPASFPAAVPNPSPALPPGSLSAAAPAHLPSGTLQVLASAPAPEVSSALSPAAVPITFPSVAPASLPAALPQAHSPAAVPPAVIPESISQPSAAPSAVPSAAPSAAPSASLPASIIPPSVNQPDFSPADPYPIANTPEVIDPALTARSAQITQELYFSNIPDNPSKSNKPFVPIPIAQQVPVQFNIPADGNTNENSAKIVNEENKPASSLDLEDGSQLDARPTHYEREERIADTAPLAQSLSQFE